jgi:hypothetical protein
MTSEEPRIVSEVRCPGYTMFRSNLGCVLYLTLLTFVRV